MKNFEFLFAAYAVFWLGICAYLFRLSLLQKRVDDRIQQIRKLLDRNRSS
ncbi:MAG: CcmD family protein [Acidobacteria bacterium]|nr:CcmD family protein [Acidobacteriota bacterium]